MAFDACEHRIRRLVIKMAKLYRQAKGLPEEKNISVLYEEMAFLLGLSPAPLSSKDADHLPSPAEMKNANGQFKIPRRDCPKCGAEQSVILAPICKSCKEAEGRKYKSIWKCEKCSYQEKLEKIYTQVLREMDVEFGNGTKKEMGIRTYTDEGLR